MYLYIIVIIKKKVWTNYRNAFRKLDYFWHTRPKILGKPYFYYFAVAIFISEEFRKYIYVVTPQNAMATYGH